MYHTAAALTAAFDARFAQSSTFDLQASASAPNVDFGGEQLPSVQAAGLTFGGAAKTRNAKAQSHFLVGGETVKAGDIVELPEADFKRMGPDGTGQVIEATDDDITAAQKASKGK